MVVLFPKTCLISPGDAAGTIGSSRQCLLPKIVGPGGRFYLILNGKVTETLPVGGDLTDD